ncbi:MAG: hypothetical protein ABEJ05_06755 [Haloglomus sp.]
MAHPSRDSRGGPDATDSRGSPAATDNRHHVRLVPVSGDWPDRVRRKLAATDWSTTPVVDVVHYTPATSTGLEGGRPHTEVHRHTGTPPRPTRYATPERACRIERVTRPLAARLGLSP